MKKQLFADLSLLAVVIVWGYTFVAIKNALAGITPFNFIALRFIAALFILLIVFRKRLSGLNRYIILRGSIVGIFLFFAYAFQTAGLKYTTASNAGFITGFSVVLVPLFSALILKARPSAESTAGVICAIAGLFFLSYNEGYVINKGDILVLFCALAVAFHILTVGYYTKKMDSILLTIVQIGVVTILSVISALIFEETALPEGSVVWGAIFVTSVFATVGAYLIQNIMQRFTSSTHTALIFSGEPVFAGIFGYYLLGERLSGWSILGCILILAGMVISELRISGRGDSDS
jgi:drug/metabolite transporter (DMT)-like permease